MAKRTCSVDGCGRPYRSRGYCNRHYQRLLTYGDPLREPPGVAERFWSKVANRLADDCWEWQGGFINSGYGTARLPDGTKTTAHRVAWVLVNGPIPPGLDVCHRCDHRPCVNPGHLFLGTRKENLADMVAKGRGERGEDRAISVLTEEDVRAIRALARERVPQREIGTRFGVTQSCVSLVVTRRNWSHVA